ncbi:MAG TPA: hypothetical protein VLX68_02215 [Chitinivibrionales bacterium]|nr:hypothetical protein [Chitinivibrionales bacterium]
MKKIVTVLALLSSLAASAWAEGGEGIRLSVKTSVYPCDSADQVGHGKVEATLRYDGGAAIPNQIIVLTATSGNFSCKLPDIANEIDSGSTDISCYTTDKNGKILVYLVNIPFNSEGKVTATCHFKDMEVQASSTYWVKRYLVKKKASGPRTASRSGHGGSGKKL